MLVLSRKCGEAILIAENVKVTVLEVKGGRVRLGIEAPREAPIHRSEIHEKINRRPAGGAYAEAALSWPELPDAALSGVP